MPLPSFGALNGMWYLQLQETFPEHERKAKRITEDLTLVCVAEKKTYCPQLHSRLLGVEVASVDSNQIPALQVPTQMLKAAWLRSRSSGDSEMDLHPEGDLGGSGQHKTVWQAICTLELPARMAEVLLGVCYSFYCPILFFPSSPHRYWSLIDILQPELHLSLSSRDPTCNHENKNILASFVKD